MRHDRFHILILSLATILLMAAATSCVEPIVSTEWEKEGSMSLTLQINGPASGLLTKADGQIKGKNYESRLFDLYVWVLPHEGENILKSDYFTYKSGQLGGSGGVASKDFELDIPASLLESVTSLDIFAIGNYASIKGKDAAISTYTTRTSLISFLDPINFSGFGKDFVQPTAYGLPMSYKGSVDISFLKYGFTRDQLTIVRNMAQSASALDPFELGEGSGKLKVTPDQQAFLATKMTIGSSTWKELDDLLFPKIELIRAVSKLRFLFAKEEALDNEKIITIKCVQLGKIDDKDKGTLINKQNVIPDKSYLFPGQYGTNWNSGDFTWGRKLTWGENYPPQFSENGSDLLADGAFLTVQFPMSLRSDSQIVDAVSGKSPEDMTAQEYDDFLYRSTSGDYEVGFKTCYLRESTRSLEGVIWYTVKNADGTGEETKHLCFDLSSISPNGFERNLSNLVYVYYDSGMRQLAVDVKVMPWIYDERIANVSNTVNVDQDGRFTVEPLNANIEAIKDPNTDKIIRYDVHLPAYPLDVTGHVVIYGPQGGTLRVKPVSDNLSSFHLEISDNDKISYPSGRHSFLEEHNYLESPIDRTHDNGRIYVYVRRSSETASAGELTFSFEIAVDDRIISADGLVIDDEYRFVIP